MPDRDSRRIIRLEHVFDRSAAHKLGLAYHALLGTQDSGCESTHQAEALAHGMAFPHEDWEPVPAKAVPVDVM